MLRLTPLLFVFVALFSVIGTTPSKRATFEENATKLKELLRKGYLIITKLRSQTQLQMAYNILLNLSDILPKLLSREQDMKVMKDNTNRTFTFLFRKHDAGKMEIKFESRLDKINEGARDADRDDTGDSERYPLLVGPLNQLILVSELVFIIWVLFTS